MAPSPFRDELFARGRATTRAAGIQGGLGLVRHRKKHDEEAVRYLRAGQHFDPMLPGTYRVLGGVYGGGLEEPKKEREFFPKKYLRIRPDGTIANRVGAGLKPTGLLATLRLEASYPCGDLGQW